MGIHPTAVIDPQVELGADVEIGPYAVVQGSVRLGDRCWLGPHAVVMGNLQLGSDCRVHSGAVLGDWPQDLSFQGAESHVVIGDRNVFREGVTVHRGTKEGSVTTIGNDCLLMANSHVAHNASLGNNVILANGALIAGYAQVGDRAFISGNCLVHQFTRVGRLAMMSGGSAVQKDLPPFCMTRSSTSNIVMGLNVVGLRRAGVSDRDRLELKRAFSILYRERLSFSEAIARLSADFQSPLVTELQAFVSSSERGICRFLRSDLDA